MAEVNFQSPFRGYPGGIFVWLFKCGKRFYVIGPVLRTAGTLKNNCGESAEFFKIKKLLSRRWRLRVYCKRAEPEVPEEAKNNERSFVSKKNGARYRGIAFR